MQEALVFTRALHRLDKVAHAHETSTQEHREFKVVLSSTDNLTCQAMFVSKKMNKQKRIPGDSELHEAMWSSVW